MVWYRSDVENLFSERRNQNAVVPKVQCIDVCHAVLLSKARFYIDDSRNRQNPFSLTGMQDWTTKIQNRMKW